MEREVWKVGFQRRSLFFAINNPTISSATNFTTILLFLKILLNFTLQIVKVGVLI